MRTDRRDRAHRRIKTRQIKGAPPQAGKPEIDSRPLDEEDLLTVVMAARIASRSARTISRAYRSGALRAYRDGNGRSVRIRYGDLRQWMMATSAAAPQCPEEEGQPSNPLERLDMGGKVAAAGPSENLALLNAARARLRPGAAPGDVGRRRVAG